MSFDMTQPPQRGTDISRLLGLHTRGARLIVGVFIASNVLFTVSTANILDHPLASYLAMVLVCAGGVIVTRPHQDPFSLALTLTTLGIVVVSSALVSYALPDAGALSRATWHLGANTWLLWFLILRRRVWLAWAGGLAMLAITVAWAHLSGRGAIAGLELASSQMLLLIIATLFGTALRRTAARIDALVTRSVDAAAAAAAVSAARAVQAERVAELAGLAVPVLTRIASDAELSHADRSELVRIEAQLRDSVRGRSLALPAVAAAAARARDRGVDVTLLDDRGGPLPSDASMDAVLRAVEDALNATESGRVTVRLLPAGRDTALTIVAQNDRDVRRVTVPSEPDR